jgi:hypothetical protein
MQRPNQFHDPKIGRRQKSDLIANTALAKLTTVSDPLHREAKLEVAGNNCRGTRQELFSRRIAAAKKIEFVKDALFATRLFAEVILQLALAQTFQYFALLPRHAISGLLRLVLPPQSCQSCLERPPIIQPNGFAGTLELNLHTRCTSGEALTQVLPRRIGLPCGRRDLILRLDDGCCDLEQSKPLDPFVTRAQPQHRLQ